MALKKAGGLEFCFIYKMNKEIYLDDVYLVTAFVPSLTACLANSPGNNNLTDV